MTLSEPSNESDGSKPQINYTFELVPESTNPKQKKIIYNEDWYFPLDKVSKKRPMITGAPRITYVKQTFWMGKNKFTHKPTLGVFETPNECSIYRIINYDVKKYGGLQFAFVGQYGYAKSTLLTTIESNLLAGKHRILQIDDAEFEAQKLAFHGFFSNSGRFHPFQINFWLPEGYACNTEADNYRPLHIERNNVSLKYFTSVKQIVSHMKPHVLNVLYREAFDSASFLRLILDVLAEIKTKTSVKKSYIIAVHEFGNLFPEIASGNQYKLIAEVALTELRKIRKFHIGILTSFHAFYDIKYFIGQKINMIGQVRPIMHKNMNGLEKAARGLKRGDVLIYNGGYYRKHHIAELPTHKKVMYNYTPHEQTWYYDANYGPISYEQLQLNLELLELEKAEQKEAQKLLDAQKKQEAKLQELDIKKKFLHESLENKEYIREQEFEFKKELREHEAKIKAELLKQETEAKKELLLLKNQLALEKKQSKENLTFEKQLKEDELLDKLHSLVQNDPTIVTSELARQLHVNYFTVKTLRKKLIQDPNFNNINNN